MLKLNYKKLISIFIFSIVLTMMLSPVVNDNSYKHVKKRSITIEKVSDLGEAVLVDGSYKVADTVYNPYLISFSDEKFSPIANEGFSTRVIEDGGKKYTELFATEKGSKIIIEIDILPNSSISILSSKQPNSQVQITPFGGGSYTLNTYSNKTDTVVLRHYPFKFSECEYIYAVKAIYYFIFFAIVFIFLLMASRLIRILQDKKYILCNNYVISFFAIFSVTMLYCIISYSTGSYPALDGMDAYYYLHPPFFNESGKLSFSYFVNHTYTFRGYLPSAISLVINAVAGTFKIDPMYLQFIPNAILISVIFGFALPMLYTEITGKKSFYLQTATAYLIFMMFWSKDLMYTLSDIPSSVSAISAIAFFIIAIRKSKTIFFAYSGLLIAIATAYRASYSLMANIFALVIFGILARKIILNFKNKQAKDRQEVKSYVIKLITFCIILVMTLLPQLAINIKRGTFSIYPYETRVWEYDNVSGSNISLVDSSINAGFSSYAFMGPTDKDAQMYETVEGVYADRPLNKFDALYIAITKPIDMVTILLKKTFVALDKEATGVYSGMQMPEYMYNLYHLLNYLVWAVFLFYMLRLDTKGNKNLKIAKYLLLFVFITSALPQILMHIEKRYFMAFYTSAQFIFSYFFIGDLLDKEYITAKIDKQKLLIYLSVFIVLCFAIRHTINANFL